MLLFSRLHPSTAFWTLLLTTKPTVFLLLAHSSRCNDHLKWILPFQSIFSSVIPKMFILATSCFTTSSLPRFMDLTFQVPVEYCSLQHWTLIPSPVTSTTGRGFCFGSISSFFLELFLRSSPVAYWEPTDLGVHLSVLYLFAFSYCSWGSQGKNTEVVSHFPLQVVLVSPY